MALRHSEESLQPIPEPSISRGLMDQTQPVPCQTCLWHNEESSRMTMPTFSHGPVARRDRLSPCHLMLHNDESSKEITMLSFSRGIVDPSQPYAIANYEMAFRHNEESSRMTMRVHSSCPSPSISSGDFFFLEGQRPVSALSNAAA